MTVLALIMIAPMWWMVSASFKPPFEIFKFPPTLLPSTWRFESYVDVFTRAPFARQYWNSVYIGVLNTGGVLVVSALAGYAFARIRFKGKTVIFVALLSALLMPEEVTILPLFVLMRWLGWLGTHIPLVIVPIFGAQAITGTFLMRQFFLSLPIELEDAARIDGAGRFKIFRHIALPLAKPALATVGVLAFLSSWNAFLEPLIFLGGRVDKLTLPIALFQYIDIQGEAAWATQLAAATLSVIPMVIVFLFAQRFFIRGFATVAVRG